MSAEYHVLSVSGTGQVVKKMRSSTPTSPTLSAINTTGTTPQPPPTTLDHTPLTASPGKINGTPIDDAFSNYVSHQNGYTYPPARQPRLSSQSFDPLGSVNGDPSERPSHFPPRQSSATLEPPATLVPARASRRSSLNLGRRNTRSAQFSDINPDEPPPDVDAAKYAEEMKKRRYSRRRRTKDDDDDDRVVFGTKVDETHVNWAMMYDMLTGIRYVVSRVEAKIDRAVTDADFAAKHKCGFDVTGNELTPSAKYDFKFKDYAPWVFRHLRTLFKIDPADYLMSLTHRYILSELGSPGKSGSFFYFSRDYKYIIKTVHHAEAKLLRKILKDYYNHVQQNPNTLLSQFYGLHRVKMPYGRKIHFVVMNNLFPPHRDIHQTYDLKGSTIGRELREEILEKAPRSVLKDLNWIRRDMRLELGPLKKQIFMSQMQKDVALLKRLKIMDYSMLIGIHDLDKGNNLNLREQALKVYDPEAQRDADPGTGVIYPSGAMSEASYSSQMSHAALPSPGVVGGAPLARSPSKTEASRKARELRLQLRSQKPVPMSSAVPGSRMPSTLTGHGMPGQKLDSRASHAFYKEEGGMRATGPDDSLAGAIYYVGIIDCLTRYDWIKRSEHFFKGLANRGKEDEISAVPPEKYGERFVQFMTKIARPFSSRQSRDTLGASVSLSARPSGERASTDGAGERVRSTETTAEGTTLPVVEEVGEEAASKRPTPASTHDLTQEKADERTHSSNGSWSSVVRHEGGRTHLHHHHPHHQQPSPALAEAVQ